MKVNQRTFKKVLKRELDKITPEHAGPGGAAIGITPATEYDSIEIQKALFKLGHVWPNYNAHGVTIVPGLRSIFVRPLPNVLSADKHHTALEMQDMWPRGEYTVLSITGIRIRICNFE